MPQFRKKPVVIEAWQLGTENPQPKPQWLLDAISEGTVHIFEERPHMIPRGNISTLEGVMHAMRGDWIIQGVKGELYPCRPDIFEATYEPVA